MDKEVNSRIAKAAYAWLTLKVTQVCLCIPNFSISPVVSCQICCMVVNHVQFYLTVMRSNPHLGQHRGCHRVHGLVRYAIISLLLCSSELLAIARGNVAEMTTLLSSQRSRRTCTIGRHCYKTVSHSSASQPAVYIQLTGQLVSLTIT